MKSLREKWNGKTTLALLAVVAGVILLFIEWRAFYPSNRDALRKQMAANGMPLPPEGMPDPARMQAMMLDNMAKELGLSSEQKERVRPLMAGMGPMGMRAIFQSSTLSREQKMAKMQAMQADNDAKIRNILTADQRKRFDTMRAEMQKRMSAMRGRMPDGTPPGGGPMGMGRPFMMPPPGGGPMGGMPPAENNATR